MVKKKTSLLLRLCLKKLNLSLIFKAVVYLDPNYLTKLNASLVEKIYGLSNSAVKSELIVACKEIAQSQLVLPLITAEHLVRNARINKNGGIFVALGLGSIAGGVLGFKGLNPKIIRSVTAALRFISQNSLATISFGAGCASLLSGFGMINTARKNIKNLSLVPGLLPNGLMPGYQAALNYQKSVKKNIKSKLNMEIGGFNHKLLELSQQAAE